MGDRLSDERLASIEGALRGFGANLLGALNDEMVAAITELQERRAADLTSEEVEALRLVPAALEDVYRRALIEATINGEDDPKRDKIDLITSTLARLTKETL
jgi:hypothetical protein